MKPLKRHRMGIVSRSDLPPYEPICSLTTECAWCGKSTRNLAPPIIDEAVDMWREKYEHLMGSLNEVIAECHLKHGTDPMREDFVKWLMSVRQEMGIDQEGEEWKDGK